MIPDTSLDERYWQSTKHRFEGDFHGPCFKCNGPFYVKVHDTRPPAPKKRRMWTKKQHS
jgi:hypothetical protein